VKRLVASTVLAVAAILPASAAYASPVRPLPTVEIDAASESAWSPAGRQLVTEAADRYAERTGHTLSSEPLVYGSTGVPVFAVRPAFVSTGRGRVASLWYVATTVTKGDTVLTVFSTRDASGEWRAVNVAAGDTEAKMQDAAPDATLLTDCRRNEWYALVGRRVLALNAGARQAIGTEAISLATYQRKVSAGSHDMSDSLALQSAPSSAKASHGTGSVLAATVVPTARKAAAESPFTDSVDHNYVPLAIGVGVILGGLLLRLRRVTRET